MNDLRALPPGPRRALPLAALVALRRDPLALLTRLARRHGDIAYVRLGGRPVYLLSHPDLVREVLVEQHRSFVKGEALRRARTLLGDGLLTSEGALHLRQRRLIQPAFHRERIAGYAETMSAYAGRAAAAWADGDTVDIADEMLRLTLAIAGKTLFDAEVEGDAAAVGAAMDELMRRFGLLMLPFGPLIEGLPIPPARRIRHARATLDAVIARLIAERRAGGDRGDLLSMLLLAQDEEGGAGMGEALVRDEVMTLFLAGHETTAAALSWAWLLLARHPEAQARLEAEVDTALGDRLPAAGDLERLPYTRAVLSEAIRLYPPAWVIGRQAVAPATVGGYSIPPGATVLMSPWVIHRDGRFYREPQRFDPGRWLELPAPARPRLAYFPFGAGPRMCVGESFAWMEGTLALATIARRWRLQLAPGQPVTPRPAVTLRPGGDTRVLLERRRPGAAPSEVGAGAPADAGCAVNARAV